MIIFLIAIVTLAAFANMAFYEYRVKKEVKNPDIMKEYILLTYRRKYKC